MVYWLIYTYQVFLKKEHAMSDSVRFLVELWNNRNLDIIDQLTTENYVLHVPQGDLQGRQALKDVASAYLLAFSSIRVEPDVQSQISQDFQVVTRVRWITELNLLDQSSGQEILRQIPAMGVTIDRIENGQIAESWDTLDTLYWLNNLRNLSKDPQRPSGDPSFVEILPVIKRCSSNGECPAGFHCKGHWCAI